jgi:hypothetical protein
MIAGPMTRGEGLKVRQAAAQATFDRFDGAAFRWSSNDCARLAAFVVRRLGHRPKMPKAGTYSSALGARRALKAAGFDSLEAALDAMGFERIPPASALPGDIVAIPGVGDWSALTVALGNGRVLGFMDGRAGAMQPKLYVCAWRVPPCPRP